MIATEKFKRHVAILRNNKTVAEFTERHTFCGRQIKTVTKRFKNHKQLYTFLDKIQQHLFLVPIIYFCYEENFSVLEYSVIDRFNQK